MFRKMPFLLLGAIFSSALVQKFLPYSLQSLLFAISLSIKTILVFLLPFVIFSLLFKTASQLARNASKLILLILGAVICSNFLSTMTSYTVAHFVYRLDLTIALPESTLELAPLWSFSLPKLAANEHAMFSGLILGILFSKTRPKTAEKVSWYLDMIVKKILKGIVSLVPLFIIGSVIKLSHDQVLTKIAKNYASIFLIIALAQCIYIASVYCIVNGLRLSQAVRSFKNMLPASIVGFGSMSSAAAMPLTILAAEKNATHPDIARSTVPATVNIHLIGDCFAIPIFAFAVLKNFGSPEPLFISYLLFAVYFVLAKFSVAAIPGGGIIVMLPLLESHFGFTPEMLSLITALYILFDPVITSANVLGNGGFSQAIDRIHSRLLLGTAKNT